jgi:hypothetical protein
VEEAMRFEVTHPIWLEGRVVPVGEVVEQTPKRMRAWLHTGSVREAAPASAVDDGPPPTPEEAEPPEPAPGSDAAATAPKGRRSRSTSKG